MRTMTMTGESRTGGIRDGLMATMGVIIAAGTPRVITAAGTIVTVGSPAVTSIRDGAIATEE